LLAISTSGFAGVGSGFAGITGGGGGGGGGVLDVRSTVGILGVGVIVTGSKVCVGFIGSAGLVNPVFPVVELTVGYPVQSLLFISLTDKLELGICVFFNPIELVGGLDIE
jgi:hypothetical protein